MRQLAQPRLIIEQSVEVARAGLLAPRVHFNAGRWLIKSFIQFWLYGQTITLINLRAHVNVLIAFLKHDTDTQTHTHTHTHTHIQMLVRFDAGLVVSRQGAQK